MVIFDCENEATNWWPPFFLPLFYVPAFDCLPPTNPLLRMANCGDLRGEWLLIGGVHQHREGNVYCWPMNYLFTFVHNSIRNRKCSLLIGLWSLINLGMNFGCAIHLAIFIFNILYSSMCSLIVHLMVNLTEALKMESIIFICEIDWPRI